MTARIGPTPVIPNGLGGIDNGMMFELTRPHADTHSTHGDNISNAECSATFWAHQTSLGTHAAPLATVWPRIRALGL